MSNFLAVATATATLRDFLDAVVRRDVAGASATAVPPNANADLPDPGVNVFLYQVTPNAAWRNADVPTRTQDGTAVQRPKAALDLHYLLSFYGEQKELKPQRVMGSVLAALHEQPFLSRKQIRDTVKAATWLETSNLDEETELVKLTQAALTLEEISKIWSVMLQTPYVLSVAFVGTLVLLEGRTAVRPTLPVRQRNLYVQTFREPVIDAVVAAANAGNPIEAGANIRITGRQLRGEQTMLRFGLIDQALAPSVVGDGEITAVLPAGLQAGIRTVQVVHPTLMGESLPLQPPTPHGGVESNAAPFMLQPAITPAAVGVTPTLVVEDPPTPLVVDGTTLQSGIVRVDFAPPVGRRQRVRLLLSEAAVPADRPARGYTFDAPVANGIADPSVEETGRIDFAFRAVFPGAYLVRAQVDGAASALATDASGRYSGPTVTI